MICERQPIGKFIDFSAGGGWGKEEKFADSTRVAIIRGADFPNVERGDYSSLPIRWEKNTKVRKVTLHPGDIVLENSGGTDTRPTGRTLFITQGLIDAVNLPIIPASFCRLIRFNSTIYPAYGFYWLQNMYEQGRTWGYQNRSTGISNFQFKIFAEAELIDVRPYAEQCSIGSLLERLDAKVRLNNRINDYLEEYLKALWRKACEKSVEKNLCSIINILPGGTPKTRVPEFWEHGDIPFFSPKDTGAPYTLKTEKYITANGLQHCSSELYPVDTVFLTARGTVGKVAIAGTPMAMNQSCFAFLGQEIAQTSVYQIIKSLVSTLKHKANGATFAAVSTKDLQTEKVLVPAPENLTLFQKRAAQLHGLLLSNTKECECLKKLRDALLLKLMSGEIEVSQIDITQLNNHLSEH